MIVMINAVNMTGNYYLKSLQLAEKTEAKKKDVHEQRSLWASFGRMGPICCGRQHQSSSTFQHQEKDI